MIVKNAVYQYLDEKTRIRIIYSSNDDLFAYVNIEANLAVPVLDSIAAIEAEIEKNNIVEIVDPFLQLVEEDNLSDTVRKRRDDNWNVIQQYWEPRKIDLINRSTRMNVFREISETQNISLMTVRRMFSRFWQRGMTPNACILDYENSGAPGKEKSFNVKTGRPRISISKDGSLGINVDDKVKKQFEVGRDKYYRNKQKKSLYTAYLEILEEFYSVTVKEKGKNKRILQNTANVPTYKQFYYWFKKNENLGIDIKKRDGEKTYELTSRPILGDARMEAPGPGFRYQIDATPANIHIVSETDRNKLIGRPVIYSIIDVYSRIVTGVYVGLETNSWNGAMMALDSMIADKAKLCAEYGIPIDKELWPSSQLPEIIIADRGEMKGHGVENLIKNFKVSIENTSPYRGDLKGIIERIFRTITEKLTGFMPGAIMKDFRKRGDADYRLEAKLTLREVTKVVLLSVLEHNLGSIDGYPLTPDMIRDNVRPIPLEIWNWGITNQKGCLRKVDQLTFRLGILPRATATFSRGTVVFHKLHYGASELLVEYKHMQIAEKKIEVVYDPRNLHNIYMLQPDGKSILLNLLEKDKVYASFSLEDVLEANKKSAILKRSADEEQLAISVQLNQEIKNIAKAATKVTNEQLNPNVSKAEKLKDIKANRAKEKAIQREKESLISSRNNNEKLADIIKLPNISDEDNTEETESMIDLIRRRKNERRKK
ncbi:Mu transposase C-terminal domain-containing protein [Anaerosinus sp.]|uniref:Mu transposase C-terminal domain-containing protein n=1 Tax=Selenobaculum sp. TaxID=3074374 RepID=UPI003AB560CB